jgi:hypothetical protein
VHIHFHFHHWMVWWLYLGLILGAIVSLNILERHLMRDQDMVLVVLGAIFWILGGVVCYALDDALSRRPPR